MKLFFPSFPSHRLLWLFIGLTLLTSCEGFFGKKTLTDFLDQPVFDNRQVAYVPILPVIKGLAKPLDVIAGWDELIYVADGGTEEIVAFDQAGIEQGRFSIPGLHAIAQDRRLDIIALGTKDTLISGTDFTLPALYRLDLNKSGTYGLSNARIKKTIVHPFYFKSSTPTQLDEAVRFEGIAIRGDNRYVLSRSGPSNNRTQFGGPDDAMLIFDENDKFVSPILVSTPLGAFNDYFKSPAGISSFAQPPQSPAVSSSGDFLFTAQDENAVLKVQWIEVLESQFGISYEVKNLAAGDTSKASSFLYNANRFIQPADVCVAGGGSRYIFVVDSEKDSLFQFNALGYEGVNPPPGSSSNKAIYASFGGTGDGLTQFRQPSGVAYINKIVYVADAGNGRVLRFKLTTDFE